ncbi:MAG: hypothetical protein ACI4VQ_04420 [Clostridia bacterium]
MEYFIIILVLIIFIVILKIGFNVKIRDIKNIKELANNEENINLIKDFPDNKQICKDILEMLNNKDVVIEETADEKSQTSLYLVMSNKILIANINNVFTRIQTIAHECIHSIQNKALLKFNFIFSNISNIYFILICILSICKVTSREVASILLIVLILIKFVSYAIRSFLEIDAMTRAEYLSQEYMQKVNIVNKETEQKITNKYKELNKIGIKLYNIVLACKSIFVVIIYCAILMFM